MRVFTFRLSLPTIYGVWKMFRIQICPLRHPKDCKVWLGDTRGQSGKFLHKVETKGKKIKDYEQEERNWTQKQSEDQKRTSEVENVEFEKDDSVIDEATDKQEQIIPTSEENESLSIVLDCQLWCSVNQIIQYRIDFLR